MLRRAYSRSLSRVPLVQSQRHNPQCIRHSSTATEPSIYDVIVIGGGPVGLAIAAALRAIKETSALKVALVESQSLSPSTWPNGDTSFSNRCSSLTPSSIEFLDRIGAWQHVRKDRVQPYIRMNVWDGVSGSKITLDWASTAGIPPPSTTTNNNTIATMTENNNLTSALLARLNDSETAAAAGLTLFPSTRVESITPGPSTPSLDLTSWPLLTLSNGSTLAARLLIGADGPNSLARSYAGISANGWDYDRHGVVATLSLSPNTCADATTAQPTAFQRFLPSGPCALLPLPDGRATMVWSTTPARAAVLKALGPDDLAAMVDAAFRLSPVDLEYLHTQTSGQRDEVTWRTQHTPFDPALLPPPITAVQPGSVASFPLRLRHADAYTGERVALAGDAAHTLHPLAGQGLNLGLADAQALAGALARHVAAGADVGSSFVLDEYAAERYAKNHVVMGVCDKLHKLYSWESGPVVWGRSLGLDAVDGFGWLKGQIMAAARG